MRNLIVLIYLMFLVTSCGEKTIICNDHYTYDHFGIEIKTLRCEEMK